MPLSHYPLLALFTLLLILSPTYADKGTNPTFTILEEQPHDSRVFTQGYLIADGYLYQSSGLYGKSFIRRYEKDHVTIAVEKKLPKNVFAEGIAHHKNQLTLLTWKKGKAYVLDAEKLNALKVFSYKGEGWGLTHNGSDYIMSNGSATLTFRDSANFKPLRTIEVRDSWRKYDKLNELEYANGYIWANVWQSPYILKISPSDGKVAAIYNLTNIVKKHRKANPQSVLNGIAYDEVKKAFWVTGKFWSKKYLVEFH